MFGGNLNKIQWLPLDHPAIAGDTITASFLKKHGIEISADQIPHDNIGNPKYKKLLQRIKEIFEKHDHTRGGLFFMLDDDMILYNRIINNL
jgi:hypothetical protein